MTARASTGFVTRFAPSPTGLLHLGHAFSALTAFRAAREAGGRFLLRIEDVDLRRCRPEFETAILEDLAWLGLSWEEPVRRQSEHMEFYRSAVAGLEGRGLLYPCFCTRTEIRAEIERAGGAPHGPEGPVYPGTCRHLDPTERARRSAAGEAAALRLDLAAALATLGGRPLLFEESGEVRTADPTPLGDAVMARKETGTSYHLSVVLDDAVQGVTHVIRGEDLLFATDLHRLLQALLELPTPAYRHHRLLLDEHGRRLAKRDRDLTIRALRESGRTPAEVRALAGCPD